MTQLTLEAVKQMTYEELAVMEGPTDVADLGQFSPMLVRYVVCTWQLHSRYADVALPDLLDAINIAAMMVPWPPNVVLKVPAAERDADVDEYLDCLQMHVSAALRPH